MDPVTASYLQNKLAASGQRIPQNNEDLSDLLPLAGLALGSYPGMFAGEVARQGAEPAGQGLGEYAGSILSNLNPWGAKVAQPDASQITQHLDPNMMRQAAASTMLQGAMGGGGKIFPPEVLAAQRAKTAALRQSVGDANAPDWNALVRTFGYNVNKAHNFAPQKEEAINEILDLANTYQNPVNPKSEIHERVEALKKEALDAIERDLPFDTQGHLIEGGDMNLKTPPEAPVSSLEEQRAKAAALRSASDPATVGYPAPSAEGTVKFGQFKGKHPEEADSFADMMRDSRSVWEKEKAEGEQKLKDLPPPDTTTNVDRKTYWTNRYAHVDENLKDLSDTGMRTRWNFEEGPDGVLVANHQDPEVSGFIYDPKQKKWHDISGAYEKDFESDAARDIYLDKLGFHIKQTSPDTEVIRGSPQPSASAPSPSAEGTMSKLVPDNVLTDEKGVPVYVAHGTTAKFDKINPTMNGQVGAHFGPRFAAEQRVYDNNLAGDRKNARIIEGYLRVKNPLLVEDVGDEWTPKILGKDLLDSGVISKDEFSTLTDDPKTFQKLLEFKGYDSLVYDNPVEGGDGYVIFHPEQFVGYNRKTSSWEPGFAGGGNKPRYKEAMKQLADERAQEARQAKDDIWSAGKKAGEKLFGPETKTGRGGLVYTPRDKVDFRKTTLNDLIKEGIDDMGEPAWGTYEYAFHPSNPEKGFDIADEDMRKAGPELIDPVTKKIHTYSGEGDIISEITPSKKLLKQAEELWKKGK